MATDETRDEIETEEDANEEPDSEAEMESVLQNILELWDESAKEMGEKPLGIEFVNTFEDHGLLTRDRGVVVHLASGAKFYLTVQRGR